MDNKINKKIQEHGITLRRYSGFNFSHPFTLKTIETHSQYYFDKFIGKIRLKAIVLDLDDTALTSEKKILISNLNEIRELKRKDPNMTTAFATGSGVHQAKRHAEQVEIDFLITDNGGAIFARKNTKYILLKHYPIPKKESLAISNKIIELSKENPDMIYHFSTPLNFIIADGEHNFKRAHDVFYPNEPFGDGVLQVSDFTEIEKKGLSKDIIKICVDFGKSEIGKKQCLEFECFLKENQINYFPTTDSKFEIAPDGVNKGTAILEILKTLKSRGIPIRPKEVVAIGDSANDEPMFELGFQSFQPSNGKSRVPVQRLTRSNNEPFLKEAVDEFKTHTTPYLLAKIKEAKAYVRNSLSTETSSSRKRERERETEIEL
ncbi:MAG: HAD family hydrolase [Clostridia bacterium]|nr:HAD family hydrolase [Clostridia bacterium]